MIPENMLYPPFRTRAFFHTMNYICFVDVGYYLDFNGELLKLKSFAYRGLC